MMPVTTCIRRKQQWKRKKTLKCSLGQRLRVGFPQCGNRTTSSIPQEAPGNQWMPPVKQASTVFSTVLEMPCFGRVYVEVLQAWRCKCERRVRKVQPEAQPEVLEEAEHATMFWSVFEQIFIPVSHKELFRWILALQSLGLWKFWALTVLSVVKVVRTHAMTQDALSAEKSNHNRFHFSVLEETWILIHLWIHYPSIKQPNWLLTSKLWK